MESENINTAIITGTNGGHHVVDGPLTTPAAREASPDLLVSDVDSRVVRIRPMATPVDQISRMVGARSASSMIVEYYSVDTRPGASTLSAAPETAPEGSTPEGQQMFVIHTADDRLFAPSETLILPEISVGKSDGSKESVIFYVNERITGTTGGLKVTALNISMTDEIPSIEAGAKIVRMGRAAAELDVQTAQFEALPREGSQLLPDLQDTGRAVDIHASVGQRSGLDFLRSGRGGHHGHASGHGEKLPLRLHGASHRPGEA